MNPITQGEPGSSGNRISKQKHPLSKGNIPESELQRPNLKKKYSADFICYDKIIVELKAVTEFDNIHEAQVFNYLKTTGFKLGILINFGKISLDYQRIVIERQSK
jgi:GxxExxY protein